MVELTGLKVHPCGFGASPRLLYQLESLREALQKNQLLDSARHLSDSLETLLKYFAGCSAGLVRRLETTRPELEALAHNLENLLHYERLLRFSISVLRGLPHPAQKSLLDVFFEDRDGFPGEPYPHSRWLQVSPSQPTGVPSLSDWTALLQGQQEPQTLAAQIATYLTVLNSWLARATNFFSLYYPVLSQPGADGRRKLLGLEKQPFSFEFLPATSWDPIGAGETTRKPGLEALPLDPRPAPTPVSPTSDFQDWYPDAAQQQPNGIVLRPGLRRPQSRSAALLEELERALSAARSVALSPHWWDQVSQQILGFVEREHSGYLLVDGEPGSGRSMLFAGLDRSLLESSQFLTRRLSLVHLTVHGIDWDNHDLVEEIDERLLQLSPSLPLKPLGSRSRRQILENTREQTQAVRLGLYLSQLRHFSGESFLLLLEGIEFSPAMLPSDLPDGVFILVRTSEESGSPTCPQMRVRLNTASHWYRDEVQRELLESELHHEVQARIDQASGGRICYLRLLIQGIKCKLLDPADLPHTDALYDALTRVLERRHGERFHRLFWLLTTARESIHLFELNLVGADPRLLIELLRELPSLFHVGNLGAGLGIPSYRQMLEGLFNWRWAKLSREYAEKAVLELTESLETQGTDHLQVRSSLDRLCAQFEQLLAWLSDVRKPDLRARSLTSERLSDLFRQISDSLETEGRYSRQGALLSRFMGALSGLPPDFQDHSVIDTMAWGYYQLALCNRRIGRLETALSSLEEARRSLQELLAMGYAESHEQLVEVFLLRSEVLSSLGEPRMALEAAEEALRSGGALFDGLQDERTRLLRCRAGLRAVNCINDMGQTQDALEKLQETLRVLQPERGGTLGGLSSLPLEREPIVPELGETMLHLARRRLEEGEIEHCRQLTAVVLAWYTPALPQFSEAFLLRATCAARQGFGEEALQLYAEAIRETTALAVEGSILGLIQLFRALCGRARVFLSQGHARSAQSDVGRAVEIGHRLVDWQAGLSPHDRLRLARGLFETLRIRRQSPLLDEQDFRQIETDAELALHLLENCPGQEDLQGQTHLFLGLWAIERTKSQRAYEHLSNAIARLKPGLQAAQAYYERARLALEAHTPSQAVRDLCQAISLHQRGPADDEFEGPPLTKCLEMRARAYVETGDYESALSDLERLLQLPRTHPLERGEWLELRSDLLLRRGENQAAIEDLEQALLLIAEPVWRSRLKGKRCRLLIDQNRAVTALEEYWESQLDQQLDLGLALSAGLEREARTRAAHGLESLSLLDRTVEILRHLVHHGQEAALVPLAQALGHLGRELAAHRRFVEAEDSYQQALRLTTFTSSEVSGLQAWLHAHMGRAEEAQEQFEKALASYTRSVELYRKLEQQSPQALATTLLWRFALLRRLNKNEEAVLELDEVLRLSPGPEESLPWLSQRAFLLRSLGRAAEAAEDFRKALATLESLGTEEQEENVVWAVTLAALDSSAAHPEAARSVQRAVGYLSRWMESTALAAPARAAEFLESLLRAALPVLHEVRGLADVAGRLIRVQSEEVGWRQLPDLLVQAAVKLHAADAELALRFAVLGAVLGEREYRNNPNEVARLRLARSLRNLAVLGRQLDPPATEAPLYRPLGKAIELMSEWTSTGELTDLDRELTQMAMAWQSLSPAWFDQVGTSKSLLFQLRRW